MGAVCTALEQTHLGTGIRYDDIQALNQYWSQIRLLYSCFEANVRASDSSVFAHEMPGGQYTNLMVSRPRLLDKRMTDVVSAIVPSVPARPRQPVGGGQEEVRGGERACEHILLIAGEIRYLHMCLLVRRCHQGHAIVEGRW